MGTLFILVGLLCLCGLSLGYECKRDLQVNVDFPGSDIQVLPSPDTEHCQHLCTQHPACLFFSFLRHDWTKDHRQFFCYLKSTPSGKPKVVSSVLGITSGFSLKPCIPDPNPCLPQVYQNVDLRGLNYRLLFTADYEECQRACTNDPACQFFTFVNGYYTSPRYRFKCHLKFSWTLPRIPKIISVAAIISGFSQRIQQTQHFSTACEGKLIPNTDIPIGNIEVLPAASPEHCQTLCSAHPLCTFFTYISQSFNCYLKNNPNEMVRKGVLGYTSGLPARFCQLDNNWIKKTYVNVDFPYSDIRYFLTDDVEVCQRTCTEDPNCQYYSYITSHSNRIPGRRRCYLKRVITLPAPAEIVKTHNFVSGFSLRNCYYKGIV